MAEKESTQTKPQKELSADQSMPSNPGSLEKGKAASELQGTNASNSDPHNTQAFLVVISELCFVMLPFIVYVLVLAYSGHIHKLFTLSEWAFASVLLLGQALARFFTLLMSGRKPKITGKPLIVFVFILVFGLIPSVIVLVFILLGSDTITGEPLSSPYWFPTVWTKFQLFFFGIAVLVYFILVGAYEYESSKEKQQNKS